MYREVLWKGRVTQKGRGGVGSCLDLFPQECKDKRFELGKRPKRNIAFSTWEKGEKSSSMGNLSVDSAQQFMVAYYTGRGMLCRICG